MQSHEPLSPKSAAILNRYRGIIEDRKKEQKKSETKKSAKKKKKRKRPATKKKADK